MIFTVLYQDLLQRLRVIAEVVQVEDDDCPTAAGADGFSLPEDSCTASHGAGVLGLGSCIYSLIFGTYTAFPFPFCKMLPNLRPLHTFSYP